MLRILHLSDVHFGEPSAHPLRKRILDGLIEAAHSEKTAPSICVFSGDLAWSGEDGQFREGEVWLQQLLRPWRDTKLLIVPGNHDVDQSPSAIPKKRSTPAEKQRERISKQVETDELPHLRTFFDWHADAKKRNALPLLSDWEASRTGFFCSEKIDGVNICFVGVNSAVMSGRLKIKTEDGSLYVHEASIERLMKSASLHDGLNIAIIHHPLEALLNWNKQFVETRLKKPGRHGAHLVLNGHRHQSEASFRQDKEGELAIFAAGAAFQQDDDWQREFHFLDIDFFESRVRRKTYRLRKDDKWKAEDEDTIVTALPPPSKQRQLNIIPYPYSEVAIRGRRHIIWSSEGDFSTSPSDVMEHHHDQLPGNVSLVVDPQGRAVASLRNGLLKFAWLNRFDLTKALEIWPLAGLSVKQLLGGARLTALTTLGHTGVRGVAIGEGRTYVFRVMRDYPEDITIETLDPAAKHWPIGVLTKDGMGTIASSSERADSFGLERIELCDIADIKVATSHGTREQIGAAVGWWQDKLYLAVRNFPVGRAIRGEPLTCRQPQALVVVRNAGRRSVVRLLADGTWSEHHHPAGI